MPSLADTAKPILPGWGYFLSGNQIERNDSPEAQAFMQALQKYDPSASWQSHSDQFGGEGGSGSGPTTYTVNYDKTKLPGGDRPAMVDMNPGAYAGFTGNPGSGYAGNLFKPDAVSKDPNGYGQVTSPRNMNLAADNSGGWLDYSPMIIAALASLGAAAPALAAGNATLGSFSTGAGGALTNGIVNGARALGNGGGLSSLIPTALSMGGSALGVNPMITGAANAAYGLSQGRKPNPISAGMSLAQLAQNSVGPGG